MANNIELKLYIEVVSLAHVERIALQVTVAVYVRDY
jgi:hypothetical protein